MKHLDTTTLNLYLDDALNANTRTSIDAHLAACELCQRELASLRALFASFDAWRAEPLPRDVSAQVMTRIAKRPSPAFVSRWGAMLLSAQVLCGGLILLWALPTVLRVASGLPLAPMPTFQFDPIANVAAMIEMYSLSIPSVALWVWVGVMIGIAVVWLIGNRLVFNSLQSKQEASQ